MATNTDLNLDTINVMELSLPSSTNSSRPESPTITNCERLRAINKDIEKFGIVIESIKSSLRGLQIAGIDDVNDPTFLDQTRRLDDYIRLQQLAVFGHMANYTKCPLYPKPRKGTPNTTKNNYSTVVNSIIRPNVSYAQAATNQNTSISKNKQQMAPQGRANPAIQTQTQASREATPPQQERPLPIAYSGTANREVAHLGLSTNRIARYPHKALNLHHRLCSPDDYVIPFLL
ncbi:hypothetical protein TNIN_338161 [Trichonephila inaurata madagascariensis]|uniref:Uncharacterized protein n=1 Tax=Trichonephila inaurata madagascariensis TaxID=2747483 RepID=A0A8X6YW55_9ARAC|nr:hypothetical protein TNIN_338161 [Trichonephila inaurata madagascariensis]